MLTLAEFGSAFAVLAPLIALVYRWLPDAVIAWRDVWVGAAATCLFVLGGSFLIGIYLGQVSPASVYGVAGSLIVLLALDLLHDPDLPDGSGVHARLGTPPGSGNRAASLRRHRRDPRLPRERFRERDVVRRFDGSLEHVTVHVSL